MAIERLTTFVSPPENPPPIREADLEAVARVYGRLPSDYIGLIRKYGPGCFDDFIWVFGVSDSPRALSLLQQAPTQIDAFGGEHEADRSFWPSESGLLPVGIADNGDLIAWKTCGDPDFWTTALLEARGSLFEEFPVSLTALLSNLMCKQIRSRILPDDFPSDEPRFKPLTT